jgi:hypothetical protein
MVMRHQYRGCFRSAQEIVQLLTHAPRHIGVQIAEGFVKQQDDGVLDQRPGKSHALLLAAGQFVRVPAFEPFQADQA